MDEKKYIIIISLSSVLLLFVGIFFVTKTTSAPQISAAQNAKAETQDPTSFDWGKIPMSEGYATKKFTIKNLGTDTLELFNVKTSCHCTKANVEIDGKSSQNFGMSGVSSWIGKVLPGKEAKINVIFDPAFHGPQGVGPVTRFVSIETNDKGNPKITYTLTGTVVK